MCLNKNMRELQAKRIDLRSKSLNALSQLKKWQSAFFRSLQVVFDEITDDFALIVTESHGLIVGESTPHIPTHF